MPKGVIDFSLITIIGFVLIVAIMVLVGFEITNDIGKALNATGISNSSSSAVGQGLAAYRQFDTGILFIVFGLGLVNIISAFAIRTHPIFFVLSFMLLLVMGVIFPQFSNLYNAVASSTSLAYTVSQFPTLNFVMQNLPFFFITIGLITAVIMFSKTRGEVAI